MTRFRGANMWTSGLYRSFMWDSFEVRRGGGGGGNWSYLGMQKRKCPYVLGGKGGLS